MTSSGTYNWSPSNASIAVEAFERCGIAPASLTRHQWLSARMSLQLVLADWSNRQGPNLWKVMGPTTVNLIQGQPTYAVPQNAVYMLDMYYTQVNGLGTGINSDRIMIPISRDEYAEYPNKLQQGTPTVYWYDKLSPIPQFTIYQAPLFSAPSYVINYYWLSRVQDANQASGETPDVPYLGLEALCADLALWLSRKPTLVGRLPPDLKADIKEAAATAWERFSSTNREDVSVSIMPKFGGYWRN